MQTQPNRWSCLPTSLAIVLDVPVKVIFELLGHDGSEILWPALGEPQQRRGFALQEMVYVAECFNRRLVHHETKWYNTPDGVNVNNFKPPEYYLWSVLRKYDGVITGVTEQGKRHAVAWVKGQIIDPRNGVESPYFQGTKESFLACCP